MLGLAPSSDGAIGRMLQHEEMSLTAAPTHLVVIGGSAGSITPLEQILSMLPADFPAAVLVVVHMNGQFRSELARVLQRSTKLAVLPARDGDVVERGHAYVATPDHHLLVEPGWKLLVTRGPKENRARPSVDALFRSAAYGYGPRVVGVILSGALDDGSAGLWAIKRFAGTAIVQAPMDAQHASMPESAMTHTTVDRVLPGAGIAAALLQLCQHPVQDEGATLPSIDDDRQIVEIEQRIAAGDYPLDAGVLSLGPPSRFGCPQCHGVLAEVVVGPLKRYRCHTGHAYTARALLEAALQESGKALDESFRVLEEIVLLCDTVKESTKGAEQRDALDKLKRDAAAGVRAIRTLLASPTLTDDSES